MILDACALEEPSLPCCTRRLLRIRLALRPDMGGCIDARLDRRQLVVLEHGKAFCASATAPRSLFFSSDQLSAILTV